MGKSLNFSADLQKIITQSPDDPNVKLVCYLGTTTMEAAQ